VDAGKLRKSIVLQRRDSTQDSYGAQVTTWSDVAQVRAEIVPMSGRELLVGQAFNAEVSHQITVRYFKELANPIEVAKLRAVYGNRIFNIHASINFEERNRMVTLYASEGLNDG
jgi:SPP1 family predicted phage head-tail adaptor